jgi:small subunit ribosomal protein S17
MKTTSTQPKTIPQRRLSGTVVSDKGAKTIIVTVERTIRHPLYGKQYTRTRRFHVHDEKEQYGVGDVVEFVECRPISKLKRWRVMYNNEAKS